MSTVRASTIADRATGKSLGVERVVEGAAKAWGSLNGGATPAAMLANASFNISSVTDAAVGQYIAHYAAPMVATAPVTIGSTVGNPEAAGFDATGATLRTRDNTNTLVDAFINLSSNGRLA
ncbi:hypothetical protein [Microvirga sp. Mcv34]|uniref:hypothetical protein n=1 Tax=Microvirga sp. Mcv34 TaxID=2926016 RepID=UPI0021CA4436|nr:hypothetical protein [Microvirga sp. Mcv34]